MWILGDYLKIVNSTHELDAVVTVVIIWGVIIIPAVISLIDMLKDTK